jgi:S-adenosylmethionine hydrolase
MNFLHASNLLVVGVTLQISSVVDAFGNVVLNVRNSALAAKYKYVLFPQANATTVPLCFALPAFKPVSRAADECV